MQSYAATSMQALHASWWPGTNTWQACLGKEEHLNGSISSSGLRVT